MQLSVGPALVGLHRYPGRACITAGLLVAIVVSPLAFSTAVYDNFTLIKQATLLVASAIVLIGLAIEGTFLPRRRALRIAVLAWCAVLALSFAFSVDIRGSVFGTYQYRQGLVTQIAYVMLLLGSIQAARWLPLRVLLGSGAIALGGVALYTGIQKTGNDPLTWWVDTADRAIGTIGNANELAAYALIALAFCAAGGALSSRWRAAIVVAVAAMTSFIIFESESRSGILALGVALCVFPVTALVCRATPRVALRETVVLIGGCASGIAIALAAGGVSGTFDRVNTGIAQSTVGNSTRLQLWKGTLYTIAAEPLTGAGPDGLAVAFPRHRPANLGGMFETQDLVAQSSHNWFLDVAANFGLPGLLALSALFGIAGAASMRRERDANDHFSAAYVWTGVAGYAAMTMLNPLSLAAHATLFVLVGALAGRAEPSGVVEASPARSSWRRWAPGLAFALPASAGMLALAVLLPLADVHASESWNAYASGNFADGARDAHEAADVMPLEVFYARRETASWLGAGVGGDTAPLVNVETALARIDRDFAFTDVDALALAMAQVGRREPPGVVAATLQRARTLAPNGFAVRTTSPTLLAAAAGVPKLHFDWDDHFVFVTVEGTAAAP